MMRFLGYLSIAALSAVYLINPTAGIIELIPDNLPWVGNLDEGGATALLLWSLRGLRTSKRKLPQESGAPAARPAS